MAFNIIGFDFNPRTRVVFGLNSIDRLGDLVRELRASRVLVVTDQGIVSAGHLDHALESLISAGVSAAAYDRVRENPTTRDVDECLEVARASGIEAIIGLGGGSSIDTAKGCNFILTNGGRMEDYRGTGKATRPMLPLIAIPTTAGTGSEVQSYALIADESTHQKMACGDPKAAPRIALLDPLLTISQPHRVTACTGIDALAHAVETAVTRRRNELSMLYSREAFRLTANNLHRVLRQPGDVEARANMQLGAAYAGIAIENSMLGAAHSAANPLTAHYGTVHGLAVGIMLPHVVRYNAEVEEARDAYRDLAVYAGLIESNAPPHKAVEALIADIEQLIATASLPVSLPSNGLTSAAIPTLAAEAAAQWTAAYNPREIGAEEFEAVYRAALTDI